jgi:hypothetical protein
MDVDEDEDGTQQVKKVPDYGIEVDFEGLDDEERQVNFIASMLMQEPYFAQMTGQLSRKSRRI